MGARCLAFGLGLLKQMVYVQKRVHVAALRQLSFERPACKVGFGLVSGNLDYATVSTIP